MIKQKLSLISSKYADERSKEIILVSHCLLNENTRYFGGAFKKNFSNEIVDQIYEKGWGIIQLPCPEQKAWGGIHKPLLWLGFDNRKTIIYPFRRIIYRFFLMHTKRVYSKFANMIIKIIKDNQKVGYEVKGIIGVGGSPTCGVKTSIDMSKIDEFGNLCIDTTNRDQLNTLFYSDFLVKKKGLLFKMLNTKLKRKKIELEFYEFDLKKEMNNEQQDLF
jgi:predicted secreted protein